MTKYPLLHNRNGHYYFRKTMPLDLAPVMGRKEILISLQTKDQAEALKAADVSKEIRQQLVGHTGDKSAHDNYGSPHHILKLYEAIVNVKYEYLW